MRTDFLGLSLVVTLAAIFPATYASGLSREEQVYAVKNWEDLHKTYHRFKGKVDGVVAGAFVDKVSELLDEQWVQIPDLNRLGKRDKRFRGFVLRQLNEATSEDRAIRIKYNAEQKCPAEVLSLCTDISNRL